MKTNQKFMSLVLTMILAHAGNLMANDERQISEMDQLTAKAVLSTILSDHELKAIEKITKNSNLDRELSAEQVEKLQQIIMSGADKLKNNAGPMI